MKTYIKPTVQLIRMSMEGSMLAGSTSVGISEDPATGPACSNGKDEPGGSSLWSDFND